MVIQNDSPEKMQIIFSGPQPRFEELAPCADCQTYTTSNIPEFCPEQGPVGTYTLEPGTYEVVVKSVGGVSVTPFTGTWTLQDGSEYFNCFYIQQEGL